MKSKKQSFLVLNQTPVLLNRLYRPICRNNKPSIIKSEDAKKFTLLVGVEAMKQKAVNVMDGDLKMVIDFCIAKGKKEPDIDAPLKLLMDSLEGVMYQNDKQIKFLQIAKHTKQDRSEIVVMVEQII